MGKPEAIVAVVRRGERVLVIRRAPQARRPGYWAPPSGRLEAGETQQAALVREVREELGLRVTPRAKVWESSTDDGAFLLHWWTAEAEPGELVADPGEVSDARWVTAEEFLTMAPVFAGDREFFARVLPRLRQSRSVGAHRTSQDGHRPPGVHPNPTGPALRPCGAVHQTRLDTARIQAARRVIDPIFLDTPQYRCDALEPDLGCTVSIKLETANPVRSFKARGTEVAASLLADNGSNAVVCASAGNLGQALAWSGRSRGLAVTVVASRFAPAAKLDRIRALDARLELVDGDFDLAREHAAAIAASDGVRLVQDSLDTETCEGAATIGLELTDTVPPFDAVLIALGGGALASGVGHVIKDLAPDVEVICVQPLGAPAMTHSWRQRRVVTTETTNTIADGVAGRCPIPAVLDDLLLVVDDAVLVQESSIIAGMRMLLDHAGLVVEPSAALGIAAVMEDRDRFAGRHVVTIVCGSNVDVDAYRRWVGAAPTHGS